MKRHVARPILAALASALAACAPDPEIGPAVGQAVPPPPGVQVKLLNATVDLDREVVVRYSLSKDGKPITGTAAAPLLPAFTLARLETDAESGSPAWKSVILTGPDTNPSVPVAGPGTAAANVLAAQRQPGAESGAAPRLRDLGGGNWAYTFSQPLPAGPAATYRAGLFLQGVPGTADSCATLDFATGGASLVSRELVKDAACSSCHGGAVRGHGGVRVGVKLCVTCHTLQNADRQTIDPAAMAGATVDTNPNPLDFGRLVHRIHRGRFLPTLYRSSSQAPAPALGTGVALPLPFLNGRNTSELGTKFSVVGEHGRENVFGRVIQRVENGLAARTVLQGTYFPRDLRSCDACHAGAAQAAKVHTEIHRRTCAGCHPDVWYGEGGTDTLHFAHTGGPQPDDSRCAKCHVTADPSDPTTKLYAPIREIHVPPQFHPNANTPVVRIVEVRDLVPGGVDRGEGQRRGPIVIFTLEDEDGTISPLNAPTPATNAASPLPRAIQGLTLTISGPTSDYQTRQFIDPAELPASESVPLTTAADAEGRFSFTFNAVLPAGATGTYAVGIDGRRRGNVAFKETLATDGSGTLVSVAPAVGTSLTGLVHYDRLNDAFRWPYTAESFTETPENHVVYVDTSVGAYPGGNPAPRRKVVELERCNVCHLRINSHGTRHDPEMCVLCHAPDKTDVTRRPKLVVNGTTTGTVDLAATVDVIEERSTALEMMLHRMHTGDHAASAVAPSPYAVYLGGNPIYRDDLRFSSDLADCTLCHAPGTWTLEAIPSTARPIAANETGTIHHAGTAAHVAGEPQLLPMTASCISCHAGANSRLHAQDYTNSRGETCLSCHGASTVDSTAKVHGVIE